MVDAAHYWWCIYIFFKEIFNDMELIDLNYLIPLLFLSEIWY